MAHITIAEEKHLFGESYLIGYIRIAYNETSVFYIYRDNSFTEVNKNGYVSTGLIAS